MQQHGFLNFWVKSDQNGKLNVENQWHDQEDDILQLYKTHKIQLTLKVIIKVITNLNFNIKVKL